MPAKRKKRKPKVRASTQQEHLARTQGAKTAFKQLSARILKRIQTGSTVLLLFILTIPSLWYLLFSPITVVGGPVVNPDDPFSSLFEVQNKGYLPIHDVDISYLVHSLESPQYKDVVLYNVTVEQEGPEVSKINPRDYMTINWAPPIVSTADITHADLEISVHYYMKLPPWDWIALRLGQTDYFRFVTVQAQDGRLLWTKRESTQQ